MTKTEARLALVEKQRRFEWQLARDEQHRAAARLVSGKTHDLLNLIQIVQLATAELAKRSPADAQEFITDLRQAAVDAQGSLASLLAVAHPEPVVTPASLIGPMLDAAVATLRPAIANELRVTIECPREATVRCAVDDFEHLVVGLVLACEASHVIELVVRERAVEGRTRLELICRPAAAIADSFSQQRLAAILDHCAGELTVADAELVALI